ncbi:MAG TPA: dihydrodipicolinate synthase family protein [Thermomicrobiales bacterium]|nr:dihydrodipicolinate synthase family protein [Thermomicrobiales bacterium]
MKPLTGIIPAIVTPMDDTGAIDEVSLRRLVAYERDEGADGLLILGLSGEGVMLSVNERERVTDIVVAVADGMPLLVGCSADTTDAAVALVRGAVARGADAVMVAPPRRPDQTQDDARAHYRAVSAAAGDCDVMVQDAPFAVGFELGVELVLELSEARDNIRSYKIEALPYWDNAIRAASVAGDGLRMYGGHAGLYLPDVIDSGAVGLIPGPEFVAPLKRAWQSFQSGDREAGDREYRRLLPALVFQAQSWALLVGSHKTLLHDRGVIASTRSRLTEANLSPSVRNRVLEIERSIAV